MDKNRIPEHCSAHNEFQCDCMGCQGVTSSYIDEFGHYHQIDWDSFRLAQDIMLEQGYIKLPSKEEILDWVQLYISCLNPDTRDFLVMGVDALWQHLGGESIIRYKSDKFTGDKFIDGNE